MKKTKEMLMQELATCYASHSQAKTDLDAAQAVLEVTSGALVAERDTSATLRATIENQKAELEKTTKELTQAKSSLEYQRGLYVKADEQVEQVHALLDALDAPPRTYKNEGGYEKPLQPMTRLAAYLAASQAIRTSSFADKH